MSYLQFVFSSHEQKKLVVAYEDGHEMITIEARTA